MKFIKLNIDIFKEYPIKEWATIFYKYMSTNYLNVYIRIKSQVIYIDEQSISEMEYSKYSQYLKNNYPIIYYDKLRILANPHVLFNYASNWINEKPKHQRKDKIVNFARADVLYKINNNLYHANLVVGLDINNNARMYDLVNISIIK